MGKIGAATTTSAKKKKNRSQRKFTRKFTREVLTRIASAVLIAAAIGWATPSLGWQTAYAAAASQDGAAVQFVTAEYAGTKVQAGATALSDMVTQTGATVQAGTPAYADTAGHWAEKAILRWSELGVLKGDDGKFYPDAPITRGELAAILNRVLRFPATSERFFEDTAGEWYEADVNALALQSAYLVSTGKAEADKALTREEAVEMFHRAVPVFSPSSGRRLSDLKDFDTVNPQYAEAVEAFFMMFFINGDTDTLFHPQDVFTRAEVVTILDNIAGVYIDQPGTYRVEEGANVVVAAPGVTLVGAGVHYLMLAPPAAHSLTSFEYPEHGTVWSEHATVDFERIELTGVYPMLANPYNISRYTLKYAVLRTGVDKRFAGGSGREGDPYIIQNEKQLRLMTEYASLDYAAFCFQLGSDIAVSGSWEPIGKGALKRLTNAEYDAIMVPRLQRYMEARHQGEQVRVYANAEGGYTVEINGVITSKFTRDGDMSAVDAAEGAAEGVYEGDGGIDAEESGGDGDGDSDGDRDSGGSSGSGSSWSGSGSADDTIGTVRYYVFEENAFFGTFDGASHAITLHINETIRDDEAFFGLFAMLCGTVKNLTLKGDYRITADPDGQTGLDLLYNVGGVAGRVYTTNGAQPVIEGCASELDIAMECPPNAYCITGGMVGCLRGGKVLGCSASGRIRSNQTGLILDVSESLIHATGGIVGYISPDTTNSVSDCVSSADVTCLGGHHTQAGGIVGLASRYSKIQRCFASGRVEAGGAYVQNDAGGIVGQLNGQFSSMAECASVADVTAHGNPYLINALGGLAGAVYDNSRISDCYSAGSVSCDDASCVGGLVGRVWAKILTSYTVTAIHAPLSWNDYQLNGSVGPYRNSLLMGGCGVFNVEDPFFTTFDSEDDTLEIVPLGIRSPFEQETYTELGHTTKSFNSYTNNSWWLFGEGKPWTFAASGAYRYPILRNIPEELQRDTRISVLQRSPGI